MGGARDYGSGFRRVCHRPLVRQAICKELLGGEAARLKRPGLARFILPALSLMRTNLQHAILPQHAGTFVTDLLLPHCSR